MRFETRETRAVLREVIDAAETFEFGKVRRDAMASIEQLKAKGPSWARNTVWWGQAGQTARALGCIVAGALGHAEVGILCILGLVVFFGWGPPLEFTPPWVDPWANFQMMVWPVVTVGYRFSAVTTRMTRSTVLEVLREDYIRTAWAKGLRERAVVIRHALKNAMLPVITLIGTEFAFLIGGLVVTETVFTLNGIGRFVVDAVAHRDYPVVQALVFLIAFGFVVVNLLVDLTYAWFDPRIRYR